MKQLLIVNSAKALNAKVGGGSVTALDLNGLDAGAITFFELGASAVLAAAPTKNFGIALGGGSDKMPFVIPEVDYDSVEVTKATPQAGTAFKRKFTMPTPVVGKEYTIIFVKKGAVPHERNTWTVTVVAASTTAATEAAKFEPIIKAKLGDVFNVTVSAAAVTIEGKKVGDAWEAKFADELTGTSWAGSTDFVDATPAIGDKAYIQDLASRCAAGKGFTDTHEFGPSVYPGYPEAVEDTTYNVYTLRFKVGRASAKTRDEKVWQLVHVAVPVGATAATAVDNIITKIKAPAAAAAGGGGAG